MSDQFPQTIRQYIRRDSLVGLHELLVAPESPQHHVADNQQRPAVTKDFRRRIQGTPDRHFGVTFIFKIPRQVVNT
jgi:hypothetical protein